MANSAAFLTSTFTSTSQPSIFEVTAQQSLAQTLGPACRHVLKVAATSQPEHCGLLIKVQDELLLLANAALQLHYLKVYNSSFTENFYGLERLADNSSKLAIRPSFLCLVLVPYLRRKLETLFQKCREDQADGVEPSNPIIARLRNILISSFPSLHCLSEAVNIAFLLRFALRKSKYHNLLSWLVGVSLVYVTPDRQKEKENMKLDAIQGSRGLRHLAITSVSTAAGILTFSLEVGSFFLQFLDWWYAQGGVGSASTLSQDGQTIPKPPPTITGKHDKYRASIKKQTFQWLLSPPSGKKKSPLLKIFGKKSNKQTNLSQFPELPARGGTCPICQRRRRGDTVLANSGLVFCYACIVQHLRKEARCPVTRLPAKEEQLVRIFTQQ